jgi:hypothetical protein
MNQKILLIDSGITVQKIVALSLDKGKYAGLIASSKEEAKRIIVEQSPELVLVSDRFEGIEWQRFPKEVETWIGVGGVLPKFVLLASRNIGEAKHYQGVLNKPFTPQALQETVATQLSAPTSMPQPLEINSISSKLNQNIMEEIEREDVTIGAALKIDERISSAREKLENLWDSPQVPAAPLEARARSESVSDLWGTGTPSESITHHNAKKEESNSSRGPEIMDVEESLAYKSLLENQVQQQLETQNLHEMVEKVLAKLLPPMVERLVQARLDQLLKEQEQEFEQNQNLHL